MDKVFCKMFFIFIFSLLLFISSSQAIFFIAQTKEDYDFSSIDDLLENAVEIIPLDGCVLLLLKDGVTIYEKSFGSYTLNTVVPIASATKWVSAVLILDLIDDGLLSLDDKVSDWIPSFEVRDGKKEITIRQCFSHTSGLPSSAICLNYQQPPWTLEMCADNIAEKDMKEPAGTVFRYGGCSMQVAGRVAELAGGDSWINLFEERIAVPLKIDSLVWDNDYPDTANPRVPGGIDQITVHDYAKLLKMLMNAGTLDNFTILSPETTENMFRDQTMGVPVASSPYDGRNDYPHLGYTVGAWIDTIDEENEIVELSSTGAWGFHPWIDLERGIIGIFLVKSTLKKVFDLVVELRMLVREIISDNLAANIPAKPIGPEAGVIGKKYSFYTSSTDPEGENISYLFDWGDGTNSGWTEYVSSGIQIEVSQSYSKRGNYEIRVKAKDSHGTESRWSEPLSVSMSRGRTRSDILSFQPSKKLLSIGKFIIFFQLLNIL